MINQDRLRHTSDVAGPHAYLAQLMAELDRAAISARLGESLSRAGLTQQEMADLLQVHKRSVENYVSPRIETVPWDRLDEWARATGVTRDWLLHGDPSEGPTAEELGSLRSDVAELRQQVDEILRVLLAQVPVRSEPKQT